MTVRPALQPPGGPSRDEIKAAITARGTTISKLSKAHGLHYQSLDQALKKRSPRANKIIADFLGRSMHELWPNWFRVDGTKASVYGAEIFEHILRRVEAGERLSVICADPRMPDTSTVKHFRRRHPSFHRRMVRAMGDRRGTEAYKVTEDEIERTIEAVRAGAPLRDSGVLSYSAIRRLFVARADVRERLAGLYRPHSLPEGEAARRRRDRQRRRAQIRRSAEIATSIQGNVFDLAEAAVSKRLPPDMRGDVVADLALALLAGDVRPEKAKAKAKELATAYNRMFNHRDLSMDFNMGDGMTLAGTISEERIAAGW